MAVIEPRWSKAFKVLSPFAKKNKKAHFKGFVREFHAFVEFWETPPPPLAHMYDDGREQATKQEELDALLMLAVQSCAKKSKMLLAEGASALAVNMGSRRHAISYVAKLHKPDLMAIFLQDKRQFKFCPITQSEMVYGHAYVLDIAIHYNSLDMVKMIIDNVDIAKCIEFEEIWTKIPTIDNGYINTHPTAIAQAVFSDKPAIVEYLVCKGYDINSRSTISIGVLSGVAISASNCIQCTNFECHPKYEVAKSTSCTLMLCDRVSNTQVATPAQVDMPVAFASCNKVMFDLMTRLGANMKLKSVDTRVCKRAVREYETAIMDERRLAFSMVLNARLGSSSIARCLDEEVTRIVLSEATPCVALEDL
jgi:hypothetical protein